MTYLLCVFLSFMCVCVLLCVCVQSKSVSSTDSQPVEERQGPSGGYASSQGGDAKRRRCDDKEPLPPHYVCTPFNQTRSINGVSDITG